MIIDEDGNFKRHPEKFPFALTFWFIHNKVSTKPKGIDRATYFAQLKRMKYLNRQLQIHPILNFGRPRGQRDPKPNQKMNLQETQERLAELIAQKKQALNSTPKTWNKLHEANIEILKMIPQLRMIHPSINQILDSLESNESLLHHLYITKDAYIYGLLNICHDQTTIYVGQTGMQRNSTNKQKKWVELERAPAQRLQEHTIAAMDKERNPKKKTSTLYRKMAAHPEQWVLIPLARIPTQQRKEAKSIEDRWWNYFFPNTYNDTHNLVCKINTQTGQSNHNKDLQDELHRMVLENAKVKGGTHNLGMHCRNEQVPHKNEFNTKTNLQPSD